MNGTQLTHQVEQQLNKGQDAFWPELISAKDLLALPPDPTRWIWDQCLPIGGCSVLVSKPKVGKTTLAANLSIAVARGIPFLGRDTQKSSVAYLSLDASLPEIADTFTSLGLKDSDAIFIHAGTAPKDTVSWLMQRVRENQVRLVVIDTLQRLFKFKDVNDYSEVTNVMDPLLEEARAQNIHLLLNHHAKKGASDDLDSAIGSTAIRGMAYTYLHLKRLHDSDRRIFRSDQRNGKNFPELALVFNREGWLEVFGTRDEAEVEEVQPKITDVLEAQEELTEREIVKTVSARAIIISKALRQLFHAEEICRTGKGRRGDPFRYSRSYILPLGEEKTGKPTGRETENAIKPLPGLKKYSSRENREENGKREEEKRNGGIVGRETKEATKWTQEL